MSSDAVRAITSNTLFWTNKSQVKKHQKIKKKCPQSWKQDTGIIDHECDAITGHNNANRPCLLFNRDIGRKLAFYKETDMTFFSTPLARQFVGFESLFDELNEMAARKESNYPAYNIAKDDEEHYRIEVALAGFSSDNISIETEKGMLKIEANKTEERANYIHQGIAQRGFSKMFRLAEHMKVDDARFVDGILTIALRREIPEADRPQKIAITNGPKKIAKAA